LPSSELERTVRLLLLLSGVVDWVIDFFVCCSASIKKNFDPEGGDTWDVVFNLAAETK
jgi:hypothetical protein